MPGRYSADDCRVIDGYFPGDCQMIDRQLTEGFTFRGYINRLISCQVEAALEETVDGREFSEFTDKDI